MTATFVLMEGWRVVGGVMGGGGSSLMLAGGGRDDDGDELALPQHVHLAAR